jgi:uracil-DNA glycosylase
MISSVFMNNELPKLQDLLHNDWKSILNSRMDADKFQALADVVLEAYQSELVYPPYDQVFEALNRCSYQKTRVVILGQDPYHGLGQAHGLSFSVPLGCKHPPSLKNILKELFNDLGLMRVSGDLSDWADQGVLLLNAALTVRAGEPASHAAIGWNYFTKAVLRVLNEKDEPIVFLLWGNFAQQFASMIDTSKHHVLQSVHPSPLSANRGGWFGSKPFSKTNAFLIAQGSVPIVWA